MNIFRDFAGRVRNAAQPVIAESGASGAIGLDRIVVEPPREVAHGDLATNAAMLLAKPLGQYSHISRVKASEFLFIAGHVAIDKAGTLVGADEF